MKLIACSKSTTAWKITKDIICKAGISTRKVTHIRSCIMNALKKKTHEMESVAILFDDTLIVSRHENNKAFATYKIWYQFRIF